MIMCLTPAHLATNILTYVVGCSLVVYVPHSLADPGLEVRGVGQVGSIRVKGLRALTHLISKKGRLASSLAGGVWILRGPCAPPDPKQWTSENTEITSLPGRLYRASSELI